MIDLIKAIEFEKEYLSHRMKGEEPFHLVDKIKECGFMSLNDYFIEKKTYQFKELEFEVIETSPERAIADVMNIMNDKTPAVLFADTEYTLVWNGNNSEFNESYCAECGIPIYQLQTGGGTIVSTAGDLNIGICIPENIGVDARYIMNSFADIFRKYTDKVVEVKGNDILVDGYKVLGSSGYNRNGMLVFITPVSLSEKSELISKICKKHSEKQPAYIDFMNAEQLRQEVEAWLRCH